MNPAGTVVYVVNSGDNTISAFHINPVTGELTPVSGSPFKSDSYLRFFTINPEGTFAYVTSGINANVLAYSIDQITGALTPVLKGPFTSSPFAAGAWPKSVTVNHSGTFAYVANEYDATISAYRINPTTGALTQIKGSSFITGKSPQMLTMNSEDTYAYVTSSAGILIYKINPLTGALSASGDVANTGSSDAITISPAGSFAYISSSDPLDGSNGSITTYHIDSASGALIPAGKPIDTGSNPGNFMMNIAGTFAFLPVENSLLVYKVNPTTGALTPVSGSPFPAGDGHSFSMVNPLGTMAYAVDKDNNIVQSFSINPTIGTLRPIIGLATTESVHGFITINIAGTFAYGTQSADNDNGNTVSTYAINPTTGAFTPAGPPVATGGSGSAMGVVTVNPAGTFAYVANYGSNNVSAFSIDNKTGVLSPVAGSLFPAKIDCK